MLISAPLTTLAQDPGEGGPVIEGLVGTSANIGSFNPLRCSGTDCARIYSFLFPGLIGVDLETADFAPADEDNDTTLALSWDISEDGTEYTFHLRDDAFWNDGTPITAHDLKFSYDAIASGEIESDFTGWVDQIIIDVEVIDDYTIKFTYGEASCDALNVAGAVIPVPRHRFNDDWTQMVESDFDRSPDVTAGIFNFERVGDGQVVLVANQDIYGFSDSIIPEGFIYVDVPDTTVAVERLLAGELNYLESPERQRRAELRENPDILTFEFPANGWNYIGLNLADPENPQNGYDEDGNFIDQGHHPIFGDVQVRRAVQLGTDVQQMVDTVSLGEGTVMAAQELPTSWALNPDLQPVPFDPAAAAELLEEAGWVMGDGDVRVCEGCQYSEEGAPLSFSLMVVDSSPNSERLALLFQDNMKDIGVQVDLQILEFNTILGNLTGQIYDAVLLAWSNSYPVNPDMTQIFGGEADVVSSGFNSGSYHNPEVMALNEQARILPGCDPDERAALYHQVQAGLQADQPYIWLYTVNDMYAARIEVDGFAPEPNAAFWNIHTWEIDTP
jgi:peptide/nickel transport system substrate-binding protein